MQSRIPLPTDNIYKFYALFGLLLVIASMLGVVYVGQSTNDTIHEFFREYQSIENPTEEKPSALEQLIERRIEIAVADKKFFQSGLGAVIGFGICLMGYGFRKWHTEIQPLQDRMLQLQLMKLESELRGVSGVEGEG